MDSFVERFNSVALTQTLPLETIEMDKKYHILIVTNVDDGRGVRVALSLILGVNTLWFCTCRPNLQTSSPYQILRR